MSFSQLPTELVQQIIEEVVSSPDYVTNYFRFLELRRVNRLFEQVITSQFATSRIQELKCRDADAMLPEFKNRLIRFRIGDHDSGNSALATYFHSVATLIADIVQDAEMRPGLGVVAGAGRLEKDVPSLVHQEPEVSSSKNADISQVDARYWLNEICESLTAVKYDIPSHDLLWMDENRARGFLERHSDPDINPQKPSQLLETAYLLSISRQHVALQDLLLRKGVSPDSSCRFFAGHALRAACRAQSLDTVRSLLEAGASVHLQRTVRYSYGIPSYFAEVLRVDNAQILDLLLDPGWNTPIVGERRAKTTAREASMNKAWKCLDVVLQKWPNMVHAKEGMVLMILRNASRHGRNNVVKAFLNAGLDPSSKTYAPECGKWFPLRDAAEGGHFSTCKLLISKGADFDVKTHGAVLSCSVAKGGSVEVLHLLMRHGLKSLSKDYIFAIAAEGGHQEMLEYAFNEGFHDVRKDSKALQAIALLAAIGQGHVTTIQYLIAKLDVSVNGVRKQGWPSIAITPLDIAIDAGSSKVVQLLKAFGANPPAEATDFSIEGRKERELLLQNKRRLHLLDRYSWKSYRGPQRLVDRALEIARQ
ncbi:ankyrin repeat-containing domain protein [Lophiotrema nucula]|uniref:Ankyrin repeat-containing domain protein n=1 Tax=Lophiotrema nucula TaxID=690887 RepID=A0A6A5YW51_9PLEO|nr:ankyrin repeat-containing domain protein [Lophiotrema nucula]